MSREQRTAERVQVNLRARWEANFDQREGQVSDISTGGCFVLTAGEVSPMELIELEIELPTGRWLRLWGQVMYYAEEIGFGLRFTGVGDKELELLTSLIKQTDNGDI
jgi:hypothetical protein